ncbi:MAG: peptidoglycan-binding protein [Faecousia sp.]
MRPLSSFVGQPIRSLQTMLRVIAEDDPTHMRIVPDGIYGPETTAAVSTFQRKHGLPVTGVTDKATWESVVAVYTPALVRLDAAQSVDIILNPGQVIRRGERNPHMYLVQAMLKVLSDVYKSVAEPTHSGILDEPTADSLSSFQVLSGLPMTGNLDKHTWKHLALQYPLAANLNNLPR